MSELYKFQHLSQKLVQLGYPSINEVSGFKVIQEDFERAYKDGRITFNDDGIHLEYDGKSYKGYMFIKEPYLTNYGGDRPKFHLTKCQTIDAFIKDGRFQKRYEFSNSNVNDLIDMSTRKLFKNEVLDYCYNCKQKLYNEIETTEDFYFDVLEDIDVIESSHEVDIFGYDKNWSTISRVYREKTGFKCEQCAFEAKSPQDRRSIHTHHKNGDKLNNKKSNLEALCVLCHAYSDEHHSKNFQKKRMKIELLAFVQKHELVLKKSTNYRRFKQDLERGLFN